MAEEEEEGMALSLQNLEVGEAAVVVVVAGERSIGLLRRAKALAPAQIQAGVVLKQREEGAEEAEGAGGLRPQVLVVAVAVA